MPGLWDISVRVSDLGIELVNFRRLRHSVGAISLLEFRPDRVRLLKLNDTCHLSVED